MLLLRQAAVSLLVFSWTCVLLVAPIAPEHVHEARGDHHGAVGHRHFLMHAPHSDDQRLSEREPAAVWIDVQGIQQSKFSCGSATAAVATAAAMLTPPTRVSPRLQTLDTSLPHGPPAVSHGLRAPPAPLVQLI